MYKCCKKFILNFCWKYPLCSSKHNSVFFYKMSTANYYWSCPDQPSEPLNLFRPNSNQYNNNMDSSY